MKSILQSAVGRFFGSAKSGTRPTKAGAKTPVASAATGPWPEAPSITPASLGARRPLISANEGVVGFEFRVSGDLRARFRLKTDPKAQAAYAATVLTSARLTAGSGRIGLARIPADWLAYPMDAEVSKGMMVALDSITDKVRLSDHQLAVEDALLTMRAAGAQIGWPPDMNFTIERDFVVVRQRQRQMNEMLEQIENFETSLKGTPVLVTDVPHLEDVELALGQGIQFVCGAMATRDSVNPKDLLPLSPEAVRIGQLLQQLVTGAQTHAIIEQIKGDVGLAYRLLRRMKTADMTHLNECTSVDQAVQLLGRNELYRWLSVMLLKAARRRQGGQAMHEIALWRARLLELLAIDHQAAAPGQLFTLGLASMLGPLLKISLQDVINTLRLPDNAQLALLEQTGPWMCYLQMAQAIESHTLDDANDLTAPFGGAQRVSELSDQAWAWASASVRSTLEDTGA